MYALLLANTYDRMLVIDVAYCILKTFLLIKQKPHALNSLIKKKLLYFNNKQTVQNFSREVIKGQKVKKGKIGL
jgi:hypothetical protein